VKRTRPGPVATGAEEFLPARPTLPRLREAAERCRGCNLYRNATQVVFGEGTRNADLMFVGEQPGDQEDRAGHPFVGPAGQLLQAALERAEIDRQKVYLTNAVKHFKFVRIELRKRRLHKAPSPQEVRACRPWLEMELQLVKPKLVVALGSTAAKSLLGPGFLVTRHRGEVLESSWAVPVMPTVHPSSVLRARDPDRERVRAEFFEDIRRAAVAVKAGN
jgi:uracil-DNA glycosylase family protein